MLGGRFPDTAMASRRSHRRPRRLQLSQFPENIRAMLLVALLLVVAVALLVDTRTIVSIAARRPVFVVARQSTNKVTFDVFERPVWIWPGHRRRPIRVLRVADWVDGTALWEIEASRPRTVHVTYGQVPEGFVQTIPAAGIPPVLVGGGWYGVIVRGEGARAMVTFNARATTIARDASPRRQGPAAEERAGHPDPRSD
jgi:hypothetical protein